MVELDAGVEPPRSPERSWKLWHLSALVALVALVMAVAVREPVLLLALGCCLAPVYGAATFWDRKNVRTDDIGRFPPHPVERIFVRAAWIGVFLMLSLIVVLCALSILAL
jgi:hypothetical protein